MAGAERMRLEDYVSIVGPLTIRVAGHRIGIETILFDYLDEGLGAEEIAWRYPTLSREEVHGVLAYYWRNKAEVDQYLKRVRDLEDELRAEQDRNPSSASRRLEQLVRERHAEYRVES
jgi:uncharacterized protein (DUF433 family)